MEWTETGTPMAVVLEFPAGDASSPGESPPSKVPRRLMQRLSEGRSGAPSSVEEIEAKLREADLRRQKFHEWLSSKARPKVKSPSWSSQEEDLGQRLEAKLYAAEQKRLSILQRAQTRLARLDELRQAAKTGAVLRFKREREELGTKVNTRIQQAEANRMLLLQAHLQRRAAVQERKTQSLITRIHRENKYRECVQKAIYQKRVAAERNRLGFLEAEKTRAHAKVMRAHRVAKSVYHQRETERRKMKEQLEARLQRAKRQRAEYLKKRGNPHCFMSNASNKMRKHGDFLSRKLARCWRQFVRSRKTTVSLTKAYESLGINKELVRLMPFEQLAGLIGSPAALGTVKALLDRFESRLVLTLSSSSSVPENIDHLLKRVASPSRRLSLNKATRSRVQTKKGPGNESVKHEPRKVSRYAVRVVLCAYMISGHPDEVFSGRGAQESELAESAASFLREFELLISVVLNGPQTEAASRPSSLDVKSVEVSSPNLLKRRTIRSQLAAFDAAWRSYLYSFVVWKVKDARLLEEDLVRAACQLELSMMQKCKLTREGEKPDLNHDMRAIQKQVTEDQRLLREKVQHLSGSDGIERMESEISKTRHKYFQTKENGSPSTSISRISSPSVTPVHESSDSSTVFLASVEKQYRVDHSTKSSNVVRSLFNDGISSSPEISPSMNAQTIPAVKQFEENEVLVNEMLHQSYRSSLVDLNVNGKEEGKIKEKIKETMEKAFWDGVTESLTKEEPDYETLISLVKEVREELCGMSPKSWKDEIHGRIDLDILSQMLDSRVNDISYLREILNYSLGLLLKLSAPANEEGMKKKYEKFWAELAVLASQSTDKRNGSFVTTVVRGLCFVLEQIQALKEEISRARIQMMGPIIRGPAGIEYLQKAFTKRYGPPSDAAAALPLTAQWMSSSSQECMREWEEHTDLMSTLSTGQVLPPATAIRSGGRFPGGSRPASSSSDSAGDAPTECKGEKIDVQVRLGLLKLAGRIEGLTREGTPETLQLNWQRLRNAQSQLQNIIVVCTSLLVLRQTLVSQSAAPPPPADVEAAVSLAAGRLSELVERDPHVGVPEIVAAALAAAAAPPERDGRGEREEVMARVLYRSLQAGDPVFGKVSGTVYLAARGLVLGGCGARGRRAAAASLQRVGGTALLDRLADTAGSLGMMAAVSCQVHRPWYVPLA
ncbi:unnamed protein product [Spirodela intermedia]|uniref:Uncharacterized protein n=1 Tax=Spirodela intermedia TaxID=51605 RepID=A0A7I8KSJ2_SPIIN|nr:unnamed protein product [Spirodela intermedia]